MQPLKNTIQCLDKQKINIPSNLLISKEQSKIKSISPQILCSRNNDSAHSNNHLIDSDNVTDSATLSFSSAPKPLDAPSTSTQSLGFTETMSIVTRYSTPPTNHVYNPSTYSQKSSTTTIGMLTRNKSKFIPNRQTKYSFNWIKSEAQFDDLIQSCQDAINAGHELVASKNVKGRYFVESEDRVIRAIFMVDEEEPMDNSVFSTLQQCCLSCFLPASMRGTRRYFQSCLNEIAVSAVDLFFAFDIVPMSRQATLISQKKTQCQQGTMQLYINGFKPATTQIPQFQRLLKNNKISIEFQLEFEKMSILDVIVGNGCRSMEDWLVHLGEDDSGTSKCKIGCINNHCTFPTTLDSLNESPADDGEEDHGTLNHPLSWTTLSYAQVPYSQQTRMSILTILADRSNWSKLIDKMHPILHQSDKTKTPQAIKQQLEVVTEKLGIVYNCLKRDGSTPMQLVKEARMICGEHDQYLDVLLINTGANTNKEAQLTTK